MHLAASVPCTQPESLQPQLRPNADRGRHSLCRSLGRASLLRTVSRLDASSPSTRDPAPFLFQPLRALVAGTVHQLLFSLQSRPSPIFTSALQFKSHLLKLWPPASSQNTQCHPVHELTLTSNSTENPKAATGQIQTQPIRVLPAAKSGFRMCNV